MRNHFLKRKRRTGTRQAFLIATVFVSWYVTCKTKSMPSENKEKTGKALSLLQGGGRGVLRMPKYKFSCEETWITRALVVIPALWCTVKQLIKIGWWQIKSVIQIYSKPILTELQNSHSGSFSDFFFLSTLPFFSPYCFLGLSPLSHSCFLSPSHSIIAKSIWNCHWEQLSRNGFVHILKTVSVIKTQRFSTKN